jgi:hypothetical protein
MIFERMLIERKFLAVYKGYFLFNYLSKLPFFRKKSYSKECTITAIFERTAFEWKKLISKERYSINRPRPETKSLSFATIEVHFEMNKYLEIKTIKVGNSSWILPFLGIKKTLYRNLEMFSYYG